MRRLVAIVFCVVAATATVPARAQNFPDHPVKIVVPYPPGGPSDTTMRVSTRNLAANLGQTVIIENVPGAGGRVGGRDVARAAPDGYTLLSGGSNENAITPALYKNLDYDPVKDFVPVAALATDSNAVVVNPAVPANSLAELVSYAKANPGKLTSGSASRHRSASAARVSARTHRNGHCIRSVQGRGAGHRRCAGQPDSA